MAVTVDQYYNDVDMKAYREFVEDFTPDEIVDFHGHVYLAEHFIARLAEARMAFTLAQDQYTFEEADADMALMYPGKRTRMLYFGAPVKQVDIAANNAYVAQAIRERGAWGLFMPWPEDDAAFLAREIKAGGFVGMKPYLELARVPALECRIPDFLSDAQLEVADKARLIVTLHIPRPLRLADPYNREDIVRVCRAAPNAAIVLAHSGRAYCLDDFPATTVEALRRLPNLYFDLALVHNQTIIEMILRAFGPEKVLYGTDSPFGAEHGKNICINGAHYYVMKEPRPWGVTPQAAVTCRFTFYAYETVRAVKMAAESLGLARADTDLIFCGNAHRLAAAAQPDRL